MIRKNKNIRNLLESLLFFSPYIIKFLDRKKFLEFFVLSIIQPSLEALKILYVINLVKYLSSEFNIVGKFEIFGFSLNLPYLQIISDNLILNFSITTFIIWAFGILFNLRFNYIRDLSGIKIIEGMRGILSSYLFNIEYDLLTIIKSGEIHNLWQIVRHVGGFFMIITSLITNFILAAVILILLFQFINYGVLIFLILGIILMCLNYFFSNLIYKQSYKINMINAKSLNLLEQILYSMKLIKLSGKIDEEKNKHLKLHQNQVKYSINLNLIKGLSISIIQLLAFILILFFISIIRKLSFDVGNLLAFSLISIRLVPIVLEIGRSINYTFEIIGMLKNLMNFLRIQVKFDIEDTINTKILNMKLNSIKLLDVSYKYGNNEVIKKTNLTLEKGKIYGVIGRTGEGKSTILDIISGFRKPIKGKIIINDIFNLNDYKKSYQKKISYLPQETIILNTSIRKNITLYEKKVSNLKIKKILRETELQEVIKNMSEGLNTKVGMRGNLLSGGQKQRIGMARTLIKKNEFLILDEPTSAMDSLTEKKILNKIIAMKSDKIILMATHRIEILDKFDAILVVADKTVIKFNSIKEFKKINLNLYRKIIADE